MAIFRVEIDLDQISANSVVVQQLLVTIAKDMHGYEHMPLTEYENDEDPTPFLTEGLTGLGIRKVLYRATVDKQAKFNTEPSEHEPVERSLAAIAMPRGCQVSKDKPRFDFSKEE